MDKNKYIVIKVSNEIKHDPVIMQSVNKPYNVLETSSLNVFRHTTMLKSFSRQS